MRSRIHRVGIDDYLVRMAFPPMPVENPGLLRLHAHTLATDPTRFQVAERHGRGGKPRIVAFGSAVERGPMWFLSMLFVEPTDQARGLGRALWSGSCRRTVSLDDSTCTDSAQPVSNGLYASVGIVPRMPFLNLLGRPRAGWTPPPLPDGTVRAPAPAADGRLEPDVQAELDALDLEVNGWAHPQDHAFDLRERPWLPVTATPAADSSATATPRRWAGLGPSPSATPPCCSRSSPTFSPRSRHAALRPSGLAATRRRRSRPASGPACDSRA